jgi:hypothetical protein
MGDAGLAKAAVAAGRSPAHLTAFQQGDRARRVALLGQNGGPQAEKTTADNGQIGTGLALQRRKTAAQMRTSSPQNGRLTLPASAASISACCGASRSNTICGIKQIFLGHGTVHGRARDAARAGKRGIDHAMPAPGRKTRSKMQRDAADINGG